MKSTKHEFNNTSSQALASQKQFHAINQKDPQVNKKFAEENNSGRKSTTPQRQIRYIQLILRMVFHTFNNLVMMTKQLVHLNIANYREPSTESDYLKQALTASYNQKNNVLRQGQTPDQSKKEHIQQQQRSGSLTASNSMPRLEHSTLMAPSSPGQIRLAKESAAVKSLTLSRLQEKVAKTAIQ